ncbi:MAG: hypothetical protein ACI4F2_00955 [Acutalibacteraceae bacterium]
MEKKKYIRAEMQITEFETEDIITTSIVDPEPPVRDDNETEIMR